MRLHDWKPPQPGEGSGCKNAAIGLSLLALAIVGGAVYGVAQVAGMIWGA